MNLLEGNISDIVDSSVPPQASELEEAVLGACILEDESLYVALENLNPSDFYNERNVLIFKAIKSLFEDSSQIDLLSIENHLRDRSQLDLVGGSGYIAELTRSVSSATYAEQHCKTIVEKRKRRDAIEGFRKLATIAADQSLDFNDVLSQADDVVFNLLSDDRAGNTHEANDYIANAYQQIINRQGAEDGITGIGTGLDVDQITAGWQNKEFIVIAARPSMGKTAFVLQSMKHAAREYGSAAVLSLEMSGTGLGERMLISEAKVNGQRSRRGQLEQHEIDQIEKAAQRLMDIGLVIDDTTFVDASRLRAKARALIHKYDIKVLAVDYVQLLTSDKDNREQQVAEISRTCKAIAKEYNIPVIGLSQLNRSCEHRTGWKKRPNLSDLRESGAIEQDADVVAFLFRPQYYGLDQYPETGEGKWSGTSTQNVCEVIFGKNRNGPTGMKRLGFEENETRFYNLQPENAVTKAMRKAKEDKQEYDYPF